LESLIDKLDLDGYIKKFKSFFAREKAIHLEGDSRKTFQFIKALEVLSISTSSFRRLRVFDEGLSFRV